MVRSSVVAALMFLLALAGLLGWLEAFLPYAALTANARTARATAASPSFKAGATIAKFGEVRHEVPLRFTTGSGHDVLAVAFAPARVLDKLELEGWVNVLYLPDEPQELLFEGDLAQIPKGWTWLLFGIASLVLALCSLKVCWSLARQARSLRRPGVDSQLRAEET